MTNSSENPVEQKQHRHPLRRAATLMAGVLLLLVLTLLLLVKVVLVTPFAARKVSEAASDFLHQPVSVAGITLINGTLYLKGVSIRNPEGHPAGELVTAASVGVSPDWWGLLRGERKVGRITLGDVRLDIRKNPAGEWNYQPLRERFARPGSGRETFVRELRVKGGALLVNGQVIDRIDVKSRDLSTTGRTVTRFTFEGRAPGNNVFRGEGTARLGAAPTAELSLDIPSLALAGLVPPARRDSSLQLAQGQGKLSLTLRLHEGSLAATGEGRFGGISLRIGSAAVPLAGTLAVRGTYRLREDEARLESATLSLNDLVRLRARGTVGELKGARKLAVEIAVDDLDLRRLGAVLPTEVRRGLEPGGMVALRRFMVSADRAHGITSLVGELLLREGVLYRGKELLFQGMAGELSLTREPRGYLVRGKLVQPHGKKQGILQELDAPFTAHFSERFRPEAAGLPVIRGVVAGIPASGSVAFSQGGAPRLIAKVNVGDLPLTSLNPFIAERRVAFSAGTATLALTAAGNGPAKVAGTVLLGLRGVVGRSGESSFTLGTGDVKGDFSREAGSISSSGDVHISGGGVAGRSVDAEFRYRLADRVLILEEGRGRSGDMTVHIARLQGKIPAARSESRGKVFPLDLKFSGVDFSQGPVQLAHSSGSFIGDFHADPAGKWLNGSGRLAVEKASYRGSLLGSMAAAIALARPGGTATVSGNLLGGNLAGAVRFDPFAREKPVSFKGTIVQSDLVRLAALLPTLPVSLTGGTAAAGVEGTYTSRDGLSARFDLQGGGVGLGNAAGKTILGEGSVSMTGGLTGKTLTIREAIISPGGEVSVRVSGTVAGLGTAGREGTLDVSLQKTTVTALLDQFVNVLPRPLQEATTGGDMAAAGTVRLTGKTVAIDGTLELTGLSLEIPSQKLTVTDAGGRVPFSLLFPGSGVKREKRPGFRRDNYPELLRSFQRAGGGEKVTIGRIRLGQAELGPATITMRGSEGRTDITSFRSELFNGALLGTGYFGYQKGPRFAADFLINDVSLRELCAAFPPIKGYITGRVDGVVSFLGEGGGIEGMAGFVDLWTRSTRGERMLVSKEFLQKLAGKNLKGFFFRSDRAYDRGEISGYLQKGYLTFTTLDIAHTNFLGIRDLSVSVAPVQNRIALDHLFTAIKEAAARGKGVKGGGEEAPAAPDTQFKWLE